MLAYSDRSGNSARCSLLCVCVCANKKTRPSPPNKHKTLAIRALYNKGNRATAAAEWPGCRPSSQGTKRHERDYSTAQRTVVRFEV